MSSIDASSALPTGFQFTIEEKDPCRLYRVELELVNFTLNLTRQDGAQILISDAVHVQSILNQTREFNRRFIKHGCDGADSNTVDDGGKEKDGEEGRNGNDNGNGNNSMALYIEIKLDPLNSVNTYRIPA